ncbi:MAG: glycosyltransferase family 39 protein [Chloroflexota bacterium]|nr:glycosyltransferase family 39 protein [Chloroflexota bacterium]
MNGLALVSIVFLLVGSYLCSFNFYPWDGWLLISLGLAGLSLSLGRLFYPQRRWRWVRTSLSPAARTRWGLRAGALLLAAGVGWMARRRPVDTDFTIWFWLWLLAVGGFAVTLLIPALRPRPRLQLGRGAGGALALLLLAALLVRVVALGRIPANFGGDEGTQAALSLDLAAQPLGNPFATGWYSVPTFSFLLYGLSMRLGGATVAGARLLSALAGTLTILTTWLLGRAWGGRRVGWVAAAVVAFSAYHIHFSRLASNQIFDPLVATLTFWLLWRAWHGEGEQAVAWWGLVGMAAGSGWYFYFGARWVTVLVALFLVWRAWVEPRFLARHRRDLWTLAAGWLVVTLPLLLWYLAHPSPFAERYRAVSIFASGWLRREIAATGKSTSVVLLQQLWKAASAFHFTPDPTFWYRPEAPLLDFVSGAFLLVGLAATLWRWRWPARGFTLLWWSSTLIAAWGITENPPSSQRGLLLLPAAALLIAWGAETLWELLARYREVGKYLPPALLVAACLLNLGFYFGVYTPRRVYGNPSAKTATELANFVQAHPVSGSTSYFYGAPYLYWNFGALEFLLRDQVGVDVQLDEAPADVQSPARFIFVAERQVELGAVMQRYPGGKLHELRDPVGTGVLAVIYDW